MQTVEAAPSYNPSTDPFLTHPTGARPRAPGNYGNHGNHGNNANMAAQVAGNVATSFARAAAPQQGGSGILLFPVT